MSEKPLKSLGNIFDCTLRDTVAVQATNMELKAWLLTLYNSGLPGKFKAWIYPRLHGNREGLRAEHQPVPSQVAGPTKEP